MNIYALILINVMSVNSGVHRSMEQLISISVGTAVTTGNHVMITVLLHV